MLTLIAIISIASFSLNLYIFWKFLPTVRTSRTKQVLIDTSTLMDGRILEVVQSGFLPSKLLVPRFVIAELQLLADKSDHQKRERARYGLQIVKDLQESKYADIEIIGIDSKQVVGVDDKLIAIAKSKACFIFTLDYNLIKVAEIEGIRVLNINQLSQEIRIKKLPGESAELLVASKGQERDQGVGYLDDGTMVVIEKAGRKVGTRVQVEFTRTLQTSSGRMMFAKIRGKY